MKKIKLNTICSLKQWKTIPKNQLIEKGYPVYGANGIIGYTDTFNHSTPTIMICCRGASCGAINVSKDKCYINGNAMALDNLDSNFLIDYVSNYLKAYDFSHVITGTAQPQITQIGLNNVYIPVLSLKEQERISNELNDINAELDICKEQLNIINELIKSQFIELFTNKNYNKISIKECVDLSIETAKSKFNKEDEIKYIDISSLDNKQNEIIGFTEYKLENAPSRAQQHIIKNDILISTVRPNLKNIAKVRYPDENLVGSSGYCVLRPRTCNSEYLLYSVLTDDFTDAMVNLATGISYPAIHDEDVLNYKIIDAPKDKQNEFSIFVQQCDKLKFIVQQRIDLLNELLNTKMHEYFDEE